MPKSNKTSPLRAPPNTLPGSSIRGMMLDKIVPAVTFVFAIGLAGGIGIGSVITQFAGPFGAWVAGIAIVAEIAILIAMLRYVRRAENEIDNMKLGMDGETIVAERLQHLIADGYHIFHDIPFDSRKDNGPNIDHVAIGPGGVFVIETKTRSKGSEYRIHIHGEQLTLDGKPTCEGAIGQTKGNARRIGEILHTVTGRTIRTQPVLALAGKWYIDDHRSDAQKRQCWVHNDVRFMTMIRNTKPTIASEDVHLFAARLREYVNPSTA